MKYLYIYIWLVIVSACFGETVKLSDLSATSSAAPTDITIVADPAGSVAPKKITFANIKISLGVPTSYVASLTQPAAGITVSGATGAIIIGLANDLAALEALSGTGYAKRTGSNAWALTDTLPWADLTGQPTTLGGYGITDGVSTSGSYANPAWLTSLGGAKITGTVAVVNGGTGTTTPSLIAGANVTVTGSWPNQTIAASGGGGSYDSTASVTTGETVLSGTVIDTSKAVCRKDISADTTFSFSGAPAAGTWFSLRVKNTDWDFFKVLTIPSSRSRAHNKLVTKTSVSSGGTFDIGGELTLTWLYDGTDYILYGEDAWTRADMGQYTVALGNKAGEGGTGADNSVFIGYGAGFNFPAGGQGVCVGYNAGANCGNYANTLVGYNAGSTGAGTSCVAVGYSAMANAAQGTGNIAIGVHALEASTTSTGTIAIGYHALNGAGNTTDTVCIGDHSGGSLANTNYCVFIGATSGIDRASTLWIDGHGSIDAGRKPLIYGEFDNRKFTVNGDGLFGRSLTNDSAVASAALEVRTSTQGFLLPRMDKSQRDAISSPATGLMIFQTDNTPGVRAWNGSNWMRFTETPD